MKVPLLKIDSCQLSKDLRLIGGWISTPPRSPHDVIECCPETMSLRRSISPLVSLIRMPSFLKTPEWILWLTIENPTSYVGRGREGSKPLRLD